jgi:peptidoglycan/xylan/chitin deacetylase (PgdA/CDA1 family)
MQTPGAFVISLDFELIWGVRDKRTIADYGMNILGVRQAIPAMLDLFAERGIGATWATVGFLFFENKDDLIAGLPRTQPNYTSERLSPYGDIAGIGTDERDDPYHFGRSLLDRIRGFPGQEIGTHTFSHFYCLEEGGDVVPFEDDLAAAKAAAARLGIRLASIVFPRNQVSAAHLRICREHGLRTFRGNESVWFHRAGRDADQSLPMRAMRLADSYLPLGGAYDRNPEVVEGLVDIPSSHFLRPAGPGRGESLRLKRITEAMEQAARRGTVFHLWWHPHNFGVNLEANLAFLRAILDRFRILQERYGMRSMTMAALAEEVRGAG